MDIQKDGEKMKNIDKKFRVSKNKLMTSVLALFSGFIVTGLIENAVTDFDEHLVPCMIIAIGVGVLGAALCIAFVKEYYMQIRDDGFELVKGKKVTKYDFSAFANSFSDKLNFSFQFCDLSRGIIL